MRATLKKMTPFWNSLDAIKTMGNAGVVVGLVITIIGVILGFRKDALQETADKNKDVANEIALRERLSAQEVAVYNVFGHKSLLLNGIPAVRTPVDNWCRPWVFMDEGEVKWKLDDSTIEACRAAIAKQPDFPFPHFFLAEALRQTNDPKWKDEAKKSLSILEKTTQIPGHHSHHDQFLAKAQNFLK
jgi:hypothetical protein